MNQNPLLECTRLSLSVVPATNAIVRRADNDTLSHMSPISTVSYPSQRVINPAPQDMSLVVAKRNRQPPGSPPRHRQSKSPLPPGSPSRRRRSKSPPVEKVAAVEKVRVVAQEDPRQAEEFALMKKHVSFY